MPVTINHKKLRRLYAEERLQVRRRGGRKRALGTRAPMASPQGPNQRWSLDFVSDTLTDSRKNHNRTVVRTTVPNSLKNERSACAAAVPRGTASPLKEGSKPSFLGAYRTTSFTKGLKWYDDGVESRASLGLVGIDRGGHYENLMARRGSVTVGSSRSASTDHGKEAGSCR